MEIRFVSSLTAEDENELAPALLRALTALLDRTQIAYTLRIQTSGNQVYQQSQPARVGSGQPESTPFPQVENPEGRLPNGGWRQGLGMARD